MFGLEDLRPPAAPDDSDAPTTARYMSQRDYMATQIVAGMMSYHVLHRSAYEDVAEMAYRLTDVMIRESKR